ncbi:uncharacterized protein LOC118737647 [Rhagoletis pomonella]|uniref:uncharacterized protein LOC118737647 n=1 Tax=Rhagoletis pomonella TaxID=28610 RepID=UPI0017872C82|nr:uncharacterized protein LOC118737647 [Rhagoletis pomonella]
MNNSSAEPIITVTLESSDMDSPVANLDAETRSLLGNGVNMPTVHKSITSSKNFWMELPQMIVVETRFITQQIATQRKIYSAQTLLPITDEQSELNNRNMSFPIATQTSPPPKLEDAASMIKPDLVDAFVSTDSPYPCRDRAQQTMKASKQMTAIGIQCNLDDDLAFVRTSRSNEESIEKKTDVKQKFLRFTREKSIFYLNGKRECMVCGQVEKNTERMLKHLALHYGPPVLCHLCGLQFEHQTLMLSHDCEMKERRSKRRRRKNQQCPIFWCGSMHRSMDALNDHIGKHLRQQRRRACVTFTLDRTVVLKRPLRTKSNYLHRCNICLRRCKNAAKFAKHRKRCVSSFMARLKEQQDIAHILILCKN